MSWKKALLLGLATFVLALIIVLPAAWVSAALPASVQCAAWSGSVWRGQCRELSLSDGQKVVMKLSTLRWRLKPAALLGLKLKADFDSTWPQGSTEGEVAVSPSGAISVRGMNGRSELDRRFFGAMPAGWHGQIDIRDFDLDWRNGVIGRLGGELVVSDLKDARGTALGGYRLRFPSSGAAPFNGELVDTGGPLEVAAQLQLTADQAWNLDGRMRVRDAGNTSLNRALDVLSFADASGWRRLTAAGQFR